MKRDFISILDISPDELNLLIKTAECLKKERKEEIFRRDLANKALGMIFEKSSTRTRISFEVGIQELGGFALFLNPDDMQLGRGEEIPDTARVLSRFLSVVMMRVFSHQTVVDFALHASIPVINGLSDQEHPCQILADILTITEYCGTTQGKKVAFIGDGNNVCNSLLLSSSMTGMDVTVASPPDYCPGVSILKKAREIGGNVRVIHDPREAVSGAEVVITDTWVSMGDENETEKRMAAFSSFSLTPELLSYASPQAIVMHCLPAHRGREITNEVIDGERSVVWDEAENRLHVQKALMLLLSGAISVS
ncbi:MAG: ornithine carbamoyltransferase [Methanospirillaceae archaeon]|nr:ornithine carbamoyltransferase [Methanospirillaceae archaeon]